MLHRVAVHSSSTAISCLWSLAPLRKTRLTAACMPTKVSWGGSSTDSCASLDLFVLQQATAPMALPLELRLLADRYSSCSILVPLSRLAPSRAVIPLTGHRSGVPHSTHLLTVVCSREAGIQAWSATVDDHNGQGVRRYPYMDPTRPVSLLPSADSCKIHTTPLCCCCIYRTSPIRSALLCFCA